ncbi:MAG: YraN family protein [Armatimonadota bacterium]
MGTERSALGRLGEDKAVEYLSNARYEIIARNYRCRSGEIDIIARDTDCLVFIEVKSRRDTRFSAPSEAVDIRKQRKIINSCRQYLIDNEMDEVSCRFDVVEVYFNDGKPIRVSHISGAFCDEG